MAKKYALKNSSNKYCQFCIPTQSITFCAAWEPLIHILWLLHGGLAVPVSTINSITLNRALKCVPFCDFPCLISCTNNFQLNQLRLLFTSFLHSLIAKMMEDCARKDGGWFNHPQNEKHIAASVLGCRDMALIIIIKGGCLNNLVGANY